MWISSDLGLEQSGKSKFSCLDICLSVKKTILAEEAKWHNLIFSRCRQNGSRQDGTNSRSEWLLIARGKAKCNYANQECY